MLKVVGSGESVLLLTSSDVDTLQGLLWYVFVFVCVCVCVYVCVCVCVCVCFGGGLLLMISLFFSVLFFPHSRGRRECPGGLL